MTAHDMSEDGAADRLGTISINDSPEFSWVGTIAWRQDGAPRAYELFQEVPLTPLKSHSQNNFPSSLLQSILRPF